MFYKLDPEVAGHLGPDTVIDRSTHPPIVHALHYELDGWPADDLITAFPCFIVTDTMKKLIENAKASGCSFGRVKISTSEQFEELEEFHPNQQLPQFSWLIVHGVAQRDDLGTTATGGSIIVSERLLEVMKGGRLDNCDIAAI
jgi:hypothetical protein